jgi:hypothetical protein
MQRSKSSVETRAKQELRERESHLTDAQLSQKQQLETAQMEEERVQGLSAANERLEEDLKATKDALRSANTLVAKGEAWQHYGFTRFPH